MTRSKRAQFTLSLLSGRLSGVPAARLAHLQYRSLSDNGPRFLVVHQTLRGAPTGMVCARLRDASSQRSDAAKHVVQDGMDQGSPEDRPERPVARQRNTLVTKSGAGDEMIMSIPGHVSGAIRFR